LRYPAAETAAKHQRVIDEASRLFRDNGFDGVSIPEIMRAAGLTHGSFYNHFTSKTDLMSACLLGGAAKAVSDMDDVESSSAGKKNYIDYYLSLAHRDDPGSGCFMAALGSEIRRAPSARGAMTRFVSSFIDKLTTHFPWPTKRHARRDAIRMTAALVGGLILARAVNDHALSEEILSEVAEGLRAGIRDS
jgi:TetR/AcrR family transcriptional repressor of nem operon